MAKIELGSWMPMPPNMGPPLPRSLGIYWPWYKPAAPPEEIVPGKVTVTLKNPPANSDGWALGIVAHDLSGSVGGYLTPLGQPVIHKDIPAAWFPLYAFVVAFSNRVPIWQVTSNPGDAWLEWYNPDFIIPSPGNYIVDAATERFEE